MYTRDGSLPPRRHTASSATQQDIAPPSLELVLAAKATLTHSRNVRSVTRSDITALTPAGAQVRPHQHCECALAPFQAPLRAPAGRCAYLDVLDLWRLSSRAKDAHSEW